MAVGDFIIIDSGNRFFFDNMFFGKINKFPIKSRAVGPQLRFFEPRGNLLSGQQTA